MKFYEPLPIRKMTAKQRAWWMNNYAIMGQPQGHTISSNSDKAVCRCLVCAETVKDINEGKIK